MKKVIVLLSLVLAILLSACGEENKPGNSAADTQERAVVSNQQQQYARVQPIPRFDYSQDRDVYIQIYTAKNDILATYTILTSYGTGDIIFDCPSIGYAIPADTSLTNPAQPVWRTGHQAVAGVDIGQAEPNGLFASNNTDGTYVLCVMDNGDIVPVYTELKVTTFPFAIAIDEQGQITALGDTSSISIELGNMDNQPNATEEPGGSIPITP